MTSVRMAGKSDLDSCDFEVFTVLTLFSARLLLEMMCLGVRTVMEAKKVIFRLETRLRSFKTFEISLKSWKWPQKWQKRHGRDVGGKWGPKAFLLKKNSGKTIREEKIEKTFYFFLVFFGRLHKNFKNFQNLFFSGRNFSIFFLAAGFSRIFF